MECFCKIESQSNDGPASIELNHIVWYGYKCVSSKDDEFIYLQN